MRQHILVRSHKLSNEVEVEIKKVISFIYRVVHDYQADWPINTSYLKHKDQGGGHVNMANVWPYFGPNNNQ